MADQYNSGIDMPYPAASGGAIIEDAFGVLVNYRPNRYPLTDKLDKRPLGSPSFLLLTDAYRPRVNVVTNSGSSLSPTATAIPVGDSSMFDLGDVFEIGVGSPPVYEAMMVVGTVAGTGGAPDSVTVQRGYAGTTAETIPDGSSIFLLTNTRTGGEVNVNAINRNPTTQEQYSQTVQRAYSISGALASSTNYVSGYGTPVQRDKWFAMTSAADDFEEALYYGRGVKLTSGFSRPGMKGLRSLIQTNVAYQPLNYANYKPSDFVRDITQPSFANGGMVSMILASPSFQVGLSVWGIPQILIPAGETKFGVSINVFSVPFLPDIPIVIAPLMRTGDFFGLADQEVAIRMKRELFDKPRGSRGDAEEGDMIMEGAIELENENHHTFVSGVTGWAKQT